MTEPNAARPVPGPPRPGTGSADGTAPAATSPDSGRPPPTDLEQIPVAQHVQIYEAEHARLQRELGTIDQL